MFSDWVSWISAKKKKCHNDRGSKIFSNMLGDVVNVQMLGKPVAFDKFLLGFWTQG